MKFRELMKRMDFVEDVGYYTRKFTRIFEMPDGLYIGHTISGTRHKFELADIDMWVKYFDRI